MSAGFPLNLSTGNIPTPEELLAQLGDFNIPPEALDVLTNYAMIVGLMGQLGQVQVGMAQADVGLADAAARQAEIDFRTQHELPFRLQEMENSRLLAELNLQLQQDRAQNERLTNAEELTQLRERGQYDTRLQSIGLQNALINLATQRESAAMQNRATRRGTDRFTPPNVGGY